MVHISSDGKGTVHGFSVGNPAGFETPSAFKLGVVWVSLDIGSVSSDTVRIHEIVTAAPELNCEWKSDGSKLKNTKVKRRTIRRYHQ